MTPQVAEVVLHRVRLPLRAPHVAAHGREDTREVILVAVVDADGTTGWGECPTLAAPGYSSEWTDGAWWVLQRILVPQVVAPRGPVGVVGHPMASGAVRDALLDLRLRQMGEGPAAALGPLADRVRFGVAVGLVDDLDALAAAAERAVAAGAALLVLKIRPGWAVAPLAAVRRDHPTVAVAVDANGSFSAADGDELAAVDALGPAFIEQPLPADDLVGGARAATALTAPVALDEAVATRGDLEAAIALGAGRMLTVKAARLGGVEAAVEVAAHAARQGWQVHAGGMLESGLGRAAARVVAARPEVTGPALVGPTQLLYAADVVAPVRPDADGMVAVPAGPGLAPEPDAELIDGLEVDRWRLDRRSPAPDLG
jgi:O-succinylbenzoate synthase